ncbi:hypothetical protein F511_12836 [Dorcoceras hygrometricum]|uniref:Uncharacterized protein n=1 Tax=Dorcoceras hygrometricum TaxID=472368 RepID=A0A2Z7CB02_9LAMI|nr:hypothetical protein F511_12836 [Dorcoceras hygrometricum]
MPLCPAWLPEDPANGQHRPKKQKSRKTNTWSSLSTKSHLKTANHATCYKSSYEMHEADKGIGNQEQCINWQNISGEPLYHAWCINRENHRSMIIEARHPISQLGGILHHSDDSVGPFRHDTSVCRSQRGSNLGSSINQSGSRCMHECHSMLNSKCIQYQYVKQNINNHTSFNLPQQISQRHGRTHPKQIRFLLTSSTLVEAILYLKFKSPEQPNSTRFRSHKKLRTNRFFVLLSNADPGLLESISRKSNPKGTQRHQSRSKQRQEMTEIDGNRPRWNRPLKRSTSEHAINQRSTQLLTDTCPSSSPLVSARACYQMSLPTAVPAVFAHHTVPLTHVDIELRYSSAVNPIVDFHHLA